MKTNELASFFGGNKQRIHQQQIIVIDDDRFFNQIASLLIKKVDPDAKVRTFEDPAAALRFLGSHNADINDNCLVFVDIYMPDMSGWKVVNKMAELPEEILKRLRIYMLSASCSQEDAEQANNHPLVSGYYAKPLTTETIRGIIKVVSQNLKIAV